MPSWDEIQSWLVGSWQLIRGRPEGLRSLDLSVDGFWNSFLAIVLAAPPMLLAWIGQANESIANGVVSTRPALIASYILIYLLAWFAPLVVIAVGARWLGVADRFVAYVIASNWGSVVIVWLFAPLSVLDLLMPGAPVLNAAQFAVFIVTCVLSWRLTNAAINKGVGPSTAVFAVNLLIAIFVIMTLHSWLGLLPPAA